MLMMTTTMMILLQFDAPLYTSYEWATGGLLEFSVAISSSSPLDQLIQSHLLVLRVMLRPPERLATIDLSDHLIVTNEETTESVKRENSESKQKQRPRGDSIIRLRHKCVFNSALKDNAYV